MNKKLLQLNSLISITAIAALFCSCAPTVYDADPTPTPTPNPSNNIDQALISANPNIRILSTSRIHIPDEKNQQYKDLIQVKYQKNFPDLTIHPDYLDGYNTPVYSTTVYESTFYKNKNINLKLLKPVYNHNSRLPAAFIAGWDKNGKLYIYDIKNGGLLKVKSTLGYDTLHYISDRKTYSDYIHVSFKTIVNPNGDFKPHDVYVNSKTGESRLLESFPFYDYDDDDDD